MHVEVSVAVNFLISYLYSKLPRRRVDLFGEDLEKGLKKKFEGHWYPDKPFKGSGFRCVRCNGEKADQAIANAATMNGMDLDEIKQYIPEELTMWIDPSEVSYRISEKSPIKILYSDRHEEDGCGEASMTLADREVQNHTFNPEAVSFQPIDSLSSSLSNLSLSNLSLSNLSLSPSSPIPPGTWSTSVSPSSALFSSPLPSAGAAHHHTFASSPGAAAAASGSASGMMGANNTSPQFTAPTFMGRTHNNPQFTAAMFAQTKFGSTKLKTQAKRPTRLSPTEMGNYFRQQQMQQQQQHHQQQQQQQQNAGLGFAGAAQSPQRPRSLSPRDPRVDFSVDRQQRLFPRGQLSPQGYQSQQGLAHTLQQQQQQQQLSPQYQHQHQLSPQYPHSYQQQQQLTFPPCSSAQGPTSPGSSYSTSSTSSFASTNNNNNANNNNNYTSMPWSLGANDPWISSRSQSTSPHLSPITGYPAGYSDLFPSASSSSSSSSISSYSSSSSYNHFPGSSAAGMLSPANSLSPPDGHKTFLDGLQQMNNMHHGYPGSLQHLLVAN